MPVGLALSSIKSLRGSVQAQIFKYHSIALQNHTEAQDVASATATFLFTRNSATALSVVFGGAIFDNQLSTLVAELPTLSNDIKQMLRTSLTSTDSSLVAKLPATQQRVLIKAHATALQDMWIFYTCAAAVGLVASLFIKHKALRTEHQSLEQGLDNEKEGAENARGSVKARKTDSHSNCR
ncbi:MAG: hypothetical protein Q9165_000826 [Trypethelium subeluteriae]